MRQKERIAVADREAVLNSQMAEVSQALAAAEAKNARLPELEMTAGTNAQEARAFRDQAARATARIAALETQLDHERKAAAEKLAVLDEAQTRFSDAFKALSAEALRHNNTSFLELAKSTLEKTQEHAKGDLAQRQSAIDALVKPMRESLEKVDAKIHDLETARAGAYEALRTQVQSLAETQTHLRSETGNLVRALRAPHVRGRWGEIQLRRVVELAGMVAHCDFVEQPTLQTEEGKTAARPHRSSARRQDDRGRREDAAERLPGSARSAGRRDARCVCSISMQRRCADTSRSFRARPTPSSSTSAPDFVVLFLPGEVFFSAALERDPTLIEYGADKKIILATPTTLIGLLMAVCYGWQQEKLAQNAREISQLGSELYKRFADMSLHFGRLGKSLNSSVDAFNKAAGNIETRVLVTARKFKELGAAPMGMEIEVLPQVEQIARELQAPELLPGPENEHTRGTAGKRR